MTVLDSGLIIRDHNGNRIDITYSPLSGPRLPVDIARIMGASAEVSGGYIVVTLDVIETEERLGSGE